VLDVLGKNRHAGYEVYPQGISLRWCIFVTDCLMSVFSNVNRLLLVLSLRYLHKGKRLSGTVEFHHEVTLSLRVNCSLTHFLFLSLFMRTK
jgi:hypothetical protein